MGWPVGHPIAGWHPTERRNRGCSDATGWSDGRMDVWHYRNSDTLHALTSVEDGGNLPDNLGPWTLIDPVTLDHGGEDEDQAIWLIGAHGYCCFE